MEEIKKQKKSRDWLTAWTILVLPGLCWSFLLWNNTSGLIAPSRGLLTWDDYLKVTMAYILIFSPVICLVWAIVHFFFVRGTRRPNTIIRRIQIAFNIALSLLIIGILMNDLLIQNNRTCAPGDYFNATNKPWCRMKTL